MGNKKSQTNPAILFTLLSLTLILSTCTPQGPAESYDLIIRNATIIDGTGEKGYRGDLAVLGEKIAALGKFNGEAPEVIDGKGFIVCPGFIDPHSHADLSLKQFPLAENLVAQGITSFLGGNCGLSPAPRKNQTFKEWLSKIEEATFSINYIPLVGHHAVRQMVLGHDYKRTARPEEIEQMIAIVEQEIETENPLSIQDIEVYIKDIPEDIVNEIATQLDVKTSVIMTLTWVLGDFDDITSLWINRN